jgi:hypothetical protein
VLVVTTRERRRKANADSTHFHCTATEGLGHLAQENLFDLFRAMSAALPGGELVETPSLSFHHTFPTNPMFKGVWATHLAADEVEEAID